MGIYRNKVNYATTEECDSETVNKILDEIETNLDNLVVAIKDNDMEKSEIILFLEKILSDLY